MELTMPRANKRREKRLTTVIRISRFAARDSRIRGFSDQGFTDCDSGSVISDEGFKGR